MGFKLKSGDSFAFAGLWDSWKQPDGSLLRTYTVLRGQVRRSLHARRQASQGSRSRNSVNRRACIQDNNKLVRT